MEQATMNTSELSAFDSLPPRYSKHQTVFGKYAASQAIGQNGWSQEQSAPFFPNTPITPSMAMTVAPQSLSATSAELLTPDSVQNYYPNGLATDGNSPLFDELDMGDMQTWESLFLEEELQGKPLVPEQTSSIISTASADVAMPVKQEHFSPKVETSAGNELPAAPQDNGEIDLNSAFDFSVLNEVEASLPATQPSHNQPATVEATVGTPAARLPGLQTPASPVSVSSPSAPKAPNGGVTKETSSSRGAKVDDLGITIYKRKPRTTPLKPVEIPTDGDDVSAKRAKNTEAARRSRARKLERMTQLEERIRMLMDENESLRSEIAVLRANQK